MQSYRSREKSDCPLRLLRADPCTQTVLRLSSHTFIHPPAEEGCWSGCPLPNRGAFHLGLRSTQPSLSSRWRLKFNQETKTLSHQAMVFPLVRSCSSPVQRYTPPPGLRHRTRVGSIALRWQQWQCQIVHIAHSKYENETV